MQPSRLWLLPASCWFLAWFILQPWRWRQHVPPKLLLTFKRTTRRYIPEYRTFHDHRYEVLKSCISYLNTICYRGNEIWVVSILSRFRSDYRRGMDWIFDLLTTCTHYSELQVIIAPSLISTLYKSSQHSLSFFFPACYFFSSRPLATASNSGDHSASCAHVITVRRILRNWTLLNCQLNCSAISSQPALQSSTQLHSLTHSLTHSPTNYFTSLNWNALRRPGVLAI
jgi:hypothetical protein